MSSPKVTLLGTSGNTYTIAYGTATYEFQAGVRRKVPVPVALEAKKKRMPDGSALFEVDIPATVVKGAKAVSARKKVTRSPKAAKKQTASAAPRQLQLELEPCH